VRNNQHSAQAWRYCASHSHMRENRKGHAFLLPREGRQQCGLGKPVRYLRQNNMSGSASSRLSMQLHIQSDSYNHRLVLVRTLLLSTATLYNNQPWCVSDWPAKSIQASGAVKQVHCQHT
jgi:hypothetical protein